MNQDNSFQLAINRSKISLADYGKHSLYVKLKDDFTQNTNPTVYPFQLSVKYISFVNFTVTVPMETEEEEVKEEEKTEWKPTYDIEE